MRIIDQIRKNIEQIEKLLSQIKADLEMLDKKIPLKSKKPAKKEEEVPCEDELRREYENLYETSITGNVGAVEEFVKSRTKKYLQAFCRANNLPIDTTKVSKDRIVTEVTRWMAQRKAITKKAT